MQARCLGCEFSKFKEVALILKVLQVLALHSQDPESECLLKFCISLASSKSVGSEEPSLAHNNREDVGKLVHLSNARDCFTGDF